MIVWCLICYGVSDCINWARCVLHDVNLDDDCVCNLVDDCVYVSRRDVMIAYVSRRDLILCHAVLRFIIN